MEETMTIASTRDAIGQVRPHMYMAAFIPDSRRVYLNYEHPRADVRCCGVVMQAVAVIDMRRILKRKLSVKKARSSRNE